MSKNLMDHVVLVDDSGLGLDGTIINNSLFDQVQDEIDEAIQQIVQTKSGSYTVLVTDDIVICTAALTLSLYAASTGSARPLRVVNTGSGAVVIDPDGSETIGGLSAWTLRPKQTAILRCDGSNWEIEALSNCRQWSEELAIPISYFRPHASGGCGALEDVLLSSGRYASACPFDGTSIESASCFLPLPRRWNLGTFTFEPYGFNTAGGSGAVVLQMAAVAAGDGETKDAAVGTFQTSTDTILTAKFQAVGPVSSAITIAGTPAVADGIRFVLQRDPTAGGDTYASDYYVETVKVRLTMLAFNDE